MTDDVDALLSPEKLEAAIRRLEAEKARRAEGKPVEAVPLVVERHFVKDQPARFAPPAQPKAEPPKARKRRKSQEARSAPTRFHIVVAKPVPGVAGDAGAIEGGYYIVQGDKVMLTDASGTEQGEWHVIVRDELYTARTALRSRLAARQPGPDHRPLRDLYRNEGWR